MGIYDKSTFSVLTASFKALKGKYTKAFVGAVAYLAPMALLALIPYVGWMLSVLLFGHLTVGYIRYIKALLNDSNPKLYTIYEMRPSFATSILIGSLYIVLVILGTVLFIIPGLLIVAFYSMSLHVFEKDGRASALENFRESAYLVEGRKMHLLSYKLLFALDYALEILIFGFLLMLIDSLYATMPILSVALLILLFVVFVLLLAVTTSYYVTANVLYFNELTKKLDEGKKVEEKPVVETKTEVVAEAKPETKKTTTRKTTTKKSTGTKSTGTKSTAKKPANKKSTTAKKTTTKKAKVEEKPAE